MYFCNKKECNTIMTVCSILKKNSADAVKCGIPLTYIVVEICDNVIEILSIKFYISK